MLSFVGETSFGVLTEETRKVGAIFLFLFFSGGKPGKLQLSHSAHNL